MKIGALYVYAPAYPDTERVVRNIDWTPIRQLEPGEKLILETFLIDWVRMLTLDGWYVYITDFSLGKDFTEIEDA